MSQMRNYDGDAKVKMKENVNALIIKSNGKKCYFNSEKKSFWGKVKEWL